MALPKYCFSVAIQSCFANRSSTCGGGEKEGRGRRKGERRGREGGERRESGRRKKREKERRKKRERGRRKKREKERRKERERGGERRERGRRKEKEGNVKTYLSAPIYPHHTPFVLLLGIPSGTWQCCVPAPLSHGCVLLSLSPHPSTVSPAPVAPKEEGVCSQCLTADCCINCTVIGCNSPKASTMYVATCSRFCFDCFACSSSGVYSCSLAVHIDTNMRICSS